MRYEFLSENTVSREMSLNGGAAKPISEVMKKDDSLLNKLNEINMAWELVVEEMSGADKPGEFLGVKKALEEEWCYLERTLGERKRQVQDYRAGEETEIERVVVTQNVVGKIIEEGRDYTLLPALEHFDVRLREIRHRGLED